MLTSNKAIATSFFATKKHRETPVFFIYILVFTMRYEATCPSLASLRLHRFGLCAYHGRTTFQLAVLQTSPALQSSIRPRIPLGNACFVSPRRQWRYNCEYDNRNAHPCKHFALLRTFAICIFFFAFAPANSRTNAHCKAT